MERKLAKRAARNGDDSAYVPPPARQQQQEPQQAPMRLLTRPGNATGPQGGAFGSGTGLAATAGGEADVGVLEMAGLLRRGLVPGTGVGRSGVATPSSGSSSSVFVPADDSGGESGGASGAEGAANGAAANGGAAGGGGGPKPTMMSREARELIQEEGGLEMWRERYYTEKLEIPPGDQAGRRQVS